MHSLPDDPTIVTEEADALGSVTLAPPDMTGRSEADLAEAMAEQVSAVAALRRDGTPHIPR